MKQTLLCMVGSLMFMSAYSDSPGNLLGIQKESPEISSVTVNDSIDNRFIGWTDEDYQIYEDSIISSLYPSVTIQKTKLSSNNASHTNDEPVVSDDIALMVNSYVPNSVTIDKSKAIGEIPIHSGTTSTGAKTYNVPIQLYPGINGFEPQLSIDYNSFMGNSIVGIGWTVSGIPTITRTGKVVHYDGKSQGITLTKDDPFTLNGIRLIKITESTTNISYETEQGNIKVKAFLSGAIIKYFEVYYPNGNKAIFGFTSTSSNMIFYPLVTLTDAWGNKIDYTYSYDNNHYRITKVAYNGASVEFQYTASRRDPVLSFSGGLKIYETNLLSRITCKFGTAVLGTYDLSYSTQNGSSLLTQIGYSAGGASFNPIKIYYGDGNTASVYKTKETQLLEWYKSDNPDMIKVVKGKFDYYSGADGLISLPYQNPYWKHYRHSTAFRHSQNRFDNRYSGDEKIFLYAGLTDDMASPMPNLKTEAGFVDIFCADIAGKQEEYVIKVNDLVVNGNDQVTFNVYRSNLYSGLSKLYTRTYSFPTVYTDADKGKSIQPKFYFTGDFTGNGKMEVLAVSCHQPFGDTGKPSKCYIFDLESNRILYQSNLFAYNVDFVGTQQSDPKAAFNNTDRLFVMDYDGDGKSDICLINDSGVNIYTFNVSGSTMTGQKVATYTELKRADLESRDLMLGEFNGDGLMDLLAAPRGSSTSWAIYNSKGNGTFELSNFNGTNNLNLRGFLVQDVNGDGLTDLIKYDANGFDTYLCNNNNLGTRLNRSTYTSNSILVPTNINSHNSFNQLVSLKEGKVTKFSFPRNDGKEVLATGMANSYGAVEKNDYSLLTENASGPGNYTKGYGAVYPYVNIYEPIPVLASCQIYVNGSQINWNYYSYTNAVIHRQGLGFRGFEKIICSSNKGSITQTYDPFNYSILKSEDGPSSKSTYNFSVGVQANKTVKIRLNSKTEESKATRISVTTSYIYDTYGNPTQTIETYPNGITLKTVNTYTNQTSESNYMLGLLTDQTITKSRNGSSSTERVQTSYTKTLPLSKIFYINGNQTQNQSFVYDNKGNTTQENVRLYSSSNTFTNKYNYDSYGRLIKIIDPKNVTNEISYNASGRVANKKDHKGKITSFAYDAFGRVLTTTYPDNSTQSLVYSWATEGTNGLYAITTTSTGRPTTKTVYDALGREVRNSQTRYNGTVLSTDNIYDSYGRVQKISLPFAGSSATQWNTYSYDSYDRLTAITEASGKKTTYSYSGLSQTVVNKGISSTKTFDALGYLISTTDPAGTVTYNLRPDGQTSSIVAPGNITTTMAYDNFGRQTSLTDPSSGTTSYAYDTSGNLIKETNANGQTITYTYDGFNRLVTKKNPEFTTNYSYSSQDELLGESTSNGTAKNYIYDEFGRLKTWKESAVDNKWLQKDYTYSSGNVSSIKYTSQSGVLATENYSYTNGYLSEVKLNGQTSIYRLTKENASGQPSEIVTGGITHSVDYNSYGVLTGMRSKSSAGSTFQNFSYTFNAGTSNLTNRKDNTRNITEEFNYDNLNRLTSFAGKTAQFDVKGNITQKSDIGSFSYANTQKPYAVSDVTLNGNSVPARVQNVSYTSFSRPNSINENGYVASFTYNGEYNRVKMNLTKNGSRELTRYYLGNCYEIDETASSSKMEKLYLAGNYYTSPVVYVRENSGSWQLYYISRDYLGSITHIANANGTIKQELSYDAWGRLRNPVNQTAYAPDQAPALFLGRGYTGHEHLPQFGLVNMNARLYDPALGRFLAPDPFVQSPDFSQNFNRYAYAMNNPLCYIDRDGQLLWFIPVGLAIIGAYIGGSVANHGELNPLKWDYKSATTYLGIGFGALAGYTGGYGIINPGTIAFAGGISTPYIAAGVTVGAVGQGTDWKFDFHWSTIAGGGGGISNSVYNPEDATNKAIKKAQWDYSAYMYASTSLALLADDPTVVGVIDDLLIPVAYGVATYQFLQDNEALVRKQTKEIERIFAKNQILKNGFVYELRATKDGYYENVRGGKTYLKTGEVWKYGQTVNGSYRYTQNYLDSKGVQMQPIFYGNQMEILIQEKIMIYGYALDKGSLPPGNRIFR